MFYHPLIARELAAAHIRDLTAEAASWRLAALARGGNGRKRAGRAAAGPPCPDAGPITAADAAAGSRGPATDQVVYRAGEQLPGPVAEVAEVRSALALLRAEYARLVTAARASVTAARAGAGPPAGGKVLAVAGPGVATGPGHRCA